jgi:hypothetical protein
MKDLAPQKINESVSSHLPGQLQHVAARSPLVQMVQGSPQVAQMASYASIANHRGTNPSGAVVQGMFTHKKKPLTEKAIRIISSWLKRNGQDADDFLAKARDPKHFHGTVRQYIGAAKISIQAILDAPEEMHADFGKYASDDEAEISDGEDQALYRASAKSSQNVKMHSLHSTSEQARVSIREMRANAKLSQPLPTIVKMGSSYFEYSPTPRRKDFGVSPMRPSAKKKDALERVGKPRTYAVLGNALDASALRCRLSMKNMNDAIQTLLFDNPNAGLADLGLETMDQACLHDLKELVAILALDIARSHNGRTAIEEELLGSTSSFKNRLGGSAPLYGGAKNQKKHGMGGVAYLKQYDQEEEEGEVEEEEEEGEGEGEGEEEEGEEEGAED